MAGQPIVVAILLVLAAGFAIMNPALLARDETVSLFGRQYTGPLVAVLFLIAGGTWLLLLLLGAVNEWKWRRRLRSLGAELEATGQEVLRLKAAVYDQQLQAAPAGSAAAQPTAPA